MPVFSALLHTDLRGKVASEALWSHHRIRLGRLPELTTRDGDGTGHLFVFRRHPPEPLSHSDLVSREDLLEEPRRVPCLDRFLCGSVLKIYHVPLVVPQLTTILPIRVTAQNLPDQNIHVADLEPYRIAGASRAQKLPYMNIHVAGTLPSAVTERTTPPNCEGPPQAGAGSRVHECTARHDGG